MTQPVTPAAGSAIGRHALVLAFREAAAAPFDHAGGRQGASDHPPGGRQGQLITMANALLRDGTDWTRRHA